MDENLLRDESIPAARPVPNDERRPWIAPKVTPALIEETTDGPASSGPPGFGGMGS